MIAVNKARDTSYLECDPDVRLMMRVREGDEDAANELTRQYHDYVQHTINYLLRGSQSTADLTQEVFLRVFRASSRYEPRAKFSTWLFTIVNNVVSNERRRMRKRRNTTLWQSSRMIRNILNPSSGQFQKPSRPPGVLKSTSSEK